MLVHALLHKARQDKQYRCSTPGEEAECCAQQISQGGVAVRSMHQRHDIIAWTKAPTHARHRHLQHELSKVICKKTFVQLGTHACAQARIVSS